MPLRMVAIPSSGQSVSNVTAAPLSSSLPESYAAALDEFHKLGGNCLHLHGEGGETHSRRQTGEWLKTRGLRPDFFLCTQICHDGWNDAQNKPLPRFHPEAVREDMATDCVPFDVNMEKGGRDLGLFVFAHANDINSGECLQGGEDVDSRLRGLD